MKNKCLWMLAGLMAAAQPLPAQLKLAEINKGRAYRGVLVWDAQGRLDRYDLYDSFDPPGASWRKTDCTTYTYGSEQVSMVWKDLIKGESLAMDLFLDPAAPDGRAKGYHWLDGGQAYRMTTMRYDAQNRLVEMIEEDVSEESVEKWTLEWADGKLSRWTSTFDEASIGSHRDTVTWQYSDIPADEELVPMLLFNILRYNIDFMPGRFMPYRFFGLRPSHFPSGVQRSRTFLDEDGGSVKFVARFSYTLASHAPGINVVTQMVVDWTNQRAGEGTESGRDVYDFSYVDLSTGVSGVAADGGKQDVYTLRGTKMPGGFERLPAGVYVHKGRKTLKK